MTLKEARFDLKRGYTLPVPHQQILIALLYACKPYIKDSDLALSCGETQELIDILESRAPIDHIWDLLEKRSYPNDDPDQFRPSPWI